MEKSSDFYEQNLEKKRAALLECQRKKQLKSCLKCKEVIGCAIRKEYVQSAYLSMNKGKGGGFEF